MKNPLLTDEDKLAISAAVKRAEARTSGEIVFALIDASARYHHATMHGAIGGMVAGTAIYLALPVEHSIALVLWTQLVCFAFFYAILPRLPWRRLLISAREMDARVREAALREFYASGLYRTAEANGVLIYLSLLERRVVVLGDKGIHEKMGDLHWDEVRNRIIAGIREGRPGKGICAAIETCGEALSTHFPHRPDDVNELPDAVIDRTLARDAP